MQSSYAEQFQRDMGCTEAEWLGWLPAAIGDSPWQRTGASIEVNLGAGHLRVRWQVMPPRVIALMRMPVLRVNFEFSNLNPEQRYVFMKRFDLYMQRGGG